MNKSLAVALIASLLSLGTIAAEPEAAPAPSNLAAQADHSRPDAATSRGATRAEARAEARKARAEARKARHAKRKAMRAANKKRKMHKSSRAGFRN